MTSAASFCTSMQINDFGGVLGFQRISLYQPSSIATFTSDVLDSTVSYRFLATELAYFSDLWDEEKEPEKNEDISLSGR